MGAKTKIALSGFIGNTHDALIVFEACRRGLLPRAIGRLSEAERKAIKSGDIYVFNEEESQIKRWTDGKRWSPSRILNNFLIYREIRSDGSEEQAEEEGGPDSSKTEIEDIDELAPSTYTAPISAPVEASTSSATSVQPSADSSNASRTIDPKLRNITGGLELLPNRKEGGLIKKTISVTGLHMISYYTAEEVIAGRLKQPGHMPELANIDISHPFLMAQFFRHPPQVTFDADQMPHFAGITDDEPMVRKPTSHPRKKKAASEQLIPGAAEGSLPPRASDLPFQTISHDPPVSSASQAPRTSLSPIAHHQHPHHMICSPAHDQSFSSVLSHVPTNVNPLLPPVRPGTGSRSSTSMSIASASDTSSPRIRSSFSHANRHEPYRVPILKHRYSITEQTQNMQQDHTSSPYSYPRQGSLPNPGMDYFREGIHQVASAAFASPIPYSAGHYSAAVASSSSVGNNGNSDYRYTLEGSHHMHDIPWQTAQNAAIPSDSPRSFYSTASSLQTGQLANGELPNAMAHQNAPPASFYTSGHISQPGYSHPAMYGGADFYATTPPVNLETGHDLATRPWYDQAVEEQPVQMNAVHPQNTSHSQPQHLIAPQAVQHLAGLLPETGYSPLLPSSAAYASEQMGRQVSNQTEPSNVKTESYSPSKHQNYGHPQGVYITAPPPPSYTHPKQDQAHQEEIKPDHSAFPQYGVRPH